MESLDCVSPARALLYARLDMDKRIIHDLEEIYKYVENVPDVLAVPLEIDNIVIIMRFSMN